MLKSAEAAAIKDLEWQRNPINVKPDDFFDQVIVARESFAKLINCKPSEVAIIPSTSYGFASALNNVPCAPGQHAMTIESEFPSGYFGLRRWCDDHNAPLHVIAPEGEVGNQGASWNQKILDSITAQTAVVVMSSVHWMNGLRFDLEKIGEKCRAVRARFIVDGTQSVGALPMDVQKCEIDTLICADYKWLFGPYSLGLAYFGPAFHEGKPIEETWMNRTNARDFKNLAEYDPHYLPDAGRYNVGQASHFVLMPMLIAALEQINEWTVPGIQEYCHHLIKPLRLYLTDLGVTFEADPYFSNHLFGLKLPKSIDQERLQKRLKENHVYLSVRGSSLRVSVNVFNTEEDITKLIATIDSVR